MVPPHARQAASINLYLFSLTFFSAESVGSSARNDRNFSVFRRICTHHARARRHRGCSAVQFANVQIATPKINMDGKILRPRRFGLVGRYICIGIPGIPISQLGTASREVVNRNEFHALLSTMFASLGWYAVCFMIGFSLTACCMFARSNCINVCVSL